MTTGLTIELAWRITWWMFKLPLPVEAIKSLTGILNVTLGWPKNDQIICLDLWYGFQMSAGSGFATDFMFW